MHFIVETFGHHLWRKIPQIGKTGQTGQTGQEKHNTFKLDFLGHLCRAAFAILVIFLAHEHKKS